METVWRMAGEIISAICEILPLSGDGQEKLAGEIYMSLTGTGGSAWLGIFARLGALASVIVFLREKLVILGKAFWDIIRDIFSKSFTLRYPEGNKKYVLFVAGGWLPLIPAAFLGGMFEKVASGNMALAIAFLLSGIFLVASDRIKRGVRNGESSMIADGPVIGIFRLLGIIPGISAMGGTVFASLLSGYDEDTAAEYSLLMLLPALLGGILVRIFTASFSVSLYEAIGSVVCLAAGGLAGWYAIKLLKKAVAAKKLKYFSYLMFAEAVFMFIIFMRG